MRERNLTILMAGLGSIGQRHVRNLRTLLGDDVNILAYRSRGTSPVLNSDMTVRQGIDLESAYGIRPFTDLEAALAEKPDAVFITNPNTLHLPVALAAVEAGCHLFIEKPVSHTLDGLDELIERVERKGLAAFVAYQFRFHPGLRWVKQLVDEGKLGRLVFAHIVNGEYLPGWHAYEDYRQTHPARRDLGGGCLRIQTHELDYALWLFGVPRSVYAVGGHLSNLEVDVEDSVSLLLDCPRQGQPMPVHIHLDYMQRPPQRVCEVIGDAGKVRYDYYASLAEFHDLATRTVMTYRFDGFDRNQMFLDELKHFLACMQGQEQPLVSLRDGLESMKISLAAERSLHSGQAVVLNEL
ncbi:MAG: Gfo/Idh/MocA family protein [Chloroflexota bacterium]